MTEDDLKRLSPAATNEFRFLFHYLIEALASVEAFKRDPTVYSAPALMQRLEVQLQDACLNVSTLQRFTEEVVALAKQLSATHQSAAIGFNTGWHTALTEVLARLPGDEYAEVRRLVQQIADGNG